MAYNYKFFLSLVIDYKKKNIKLNSEPLFVIFAVDF